MAVGKKTGGRRRGTPNKATAAREAAIAACGITPLEFMLKIMRDPKREPNTQLDAARAAAPYVHPRLAAIEHTGRDGERLFTEEPSTRELARVLLNSFPQLAGYARWLEQEQK